MLTKQEKWLLKQIERELKNSWIADLFEFYDELEPIYIEAVKAMGTSEPISIASDSTNWCDKSMMVSNSTNSSDEGRE